MGTQNRKNNRIWISVVVVLLVAITFSVYFFVNNQQVKFEQKDNKTPLSTSGETTKAVSCTRTTRLENISSFDRALSLIHERYSIWEQGNPKNFGTYHFFPSKLINCVKIIENDVKNSKGVEGYFVFNDSSIEANYFPIYVDKDYGETDNLITALLLVHEITHVRQYLDLLNGGENFSCIDKETEAFDAAFNFARWQYGESEKTLNLRLEYDENLHPQLQIYKTIIDSFPKVITSLYELCNGDFGDSCSDLITKNRRNMIKAVVSKDAFYIEQCKL